MDTAKGDIDCSVHVTSLRTHQGNVPGDGAVKVKGQERQVWVKGCAERIDTICQSVAQAIPLDEEIQALLKSSR
jgi:hypothetical protein